MVKARCLLVLGPLISNPHHSQLTYALLATSLHPGMFSSCMLSDLPTLGLLLVG